MSTAVDLTAVLIRLFVGTILLVAGAMKLTSPCSLVAAVEALSFPRSLAMAAAPIVVAAEGGVGAWLIVGRGRAELTAALIMFITFAVVLLVGFARHGGEYSCACFGTQRTGGVMFGVAQNIVLIGALLVAVRLQSRSRS